MVTILTLLLFYISVRLMFALPQLLFEKKTVKEAVRYSLEKTRNALLVLYLELALDCRQNLHIFHSFMIPILTSQALIGWFDP